MMEVSKSSSSPLQKRKQTNDQKVDIIIRNPLISTKILSLLDARSLSCARASTPYWTGICNELISGRREVTLVSYVYDTLFENQRTTRFRSRNSDGFLHIDPWIRLLLANNLFGHDIQQMVDYLSGFLRDKQWSKPKFGFLFHVGVKTPSPLIPVIRKYLPPDCQTIILSSRSGFITGLFNTSLQPPKFQCTEIYGNVRFAGMSYLFCSDFGFEVTLFDEKNTLTEFEPKEDNSHKKLKAIMIFSTSYVKREERQEVYINYDYVNKTFEKYDRKIALAGVVVDGIQVPPTTGLWLDKRTANYSKRFCGLAVSGDNIKTASGVFDSDSLATFEEELQQFRTSLDFDPDIRTKRHFTFGFLFTCSGRGSSLFEEPNVEVRTINKIFPQVVFNGIFGNGEFGENFWPRSAELGINKATEDEETKFWHFFTNIILLINVQLN